MNGQEDKEKEILEILCRAHGLNPIVYIFRHILCAH